jgi:hypothetical protein
MLKNKSLIHIIGGGFLVICFGIALVGGVIELYQAVVNNKSDAILIASFAGFVISFITDLFVFKRSAILAFFNSTFILVAMFVLLSIAFN